MFICYDDRLLIRIVRTLPEDQDYAYEDGML
jgi:hypothetical protein